ncbi:preprotein translocase subunit SecG [Mesomycoplasma hyorhinis]|uniref:Protein-export membrane protein SecG n=3 Tax=Mesomycoplasma hyorhinis TaxID=2100 RepID=A0AAJ2YPY6_MESHY|nr:preprotein translocase subunit SecG [Mesomycoplasma hyorhinis]ADM21921.1 Preprotein translocase, SecG subunit [Mesomycoplasma hyorhinis HUB-1]AEC46247.1 preprotein translocase, SecG subunit [Mesomycoplasma hyorhinis MCLD]AEX14246.1 preprotein translocase, SecG subunit [Mesomycoplasma hyorhinis GDL-1]AHA41252.1 preprotein translocase, SecG subunit [Mesomycoplasma hyorhinis DBS 1050]AOD25488.1 Preprotein translocase, SecG subunit [Mesomycoplasma hyorhinis]
MLKELLLGIIILISLCIMILSLLMSPHSNSFSGALVGSSDLDLFKVSKERGFRKFTKWAMFICGLLFLTIALIIRLL